MADVKTAYGATAQAFTCTLASLASSATAGRESTVIDNTSDEYVDALVMLQAKLQTGTPASDKAIYCYAYGTVDTSTPTYPDKVTGADAAITLDDPTQLKLLGTIFAFAAGGLTYKGGPWSVASVFGGVLPQKWGIVVRNFTNITLTATEGDHKKLWQGIYATVG
jgi:hypothetical protein